MQVIYSEEERKYNKEITVGLIRSELLNLTEYNVHMAKLIDGGRNSMSKEDIFYGFTFFYIIIIIVIIIMKQLLWMNVQRLQPNFPFPFFKPWLSRNLKLFQNFTILLMLWQRFVFVLESLHSLPCLQFLTIILFFSLLQSLDALSHYHSFLT